MMQRRQLLTALTLAAIALAPAHAQTFPSKPVTIVVPYTAGGLTDVVARVIAPRLAERWGQNVVVENRAGGGTTIGRSDPHFRNHSFRASLNFRF